MRTPLSLSLTFLCLSFALLSLEAQRDLSIVAEENSQNSEAYIVTFDEVPSSRKLKRKGIQIQSYLGNNRYIITSNKGKKPRKIDSQALAVQYKIQSELTASIAARKSVDAINVIIDFQQRPKNLALWLKKYNGEIIEDYYGENTIVAKLAPKFIGEIAKESRVKFIDFEPEEVSPMNHEAAVVMNTRTVYLPNYGKLTGKGVIVGIGDGGKLGNHLDFDGRINNKAFGTYTSFGEHGDLVAGNVGGGGHLKPIHKGTAPEATLMIQKTTRILTKAPGYVTEGMVLTNNSYGSAINCNTAGLYDYSSRMVDEQMNMYPKLLHVFAVGNSGELKCSDKTTGYHSILKSYASAKNNLTVGAVSLDKELLFYSGKGPTKDGRIKPEICGVSDKIVSTRRNFNYGNFGGSSAATALVTGSLALMHEAYQNTYNSLPDNALLKAIACNTAEDRGHEGPDYKYGFGLVDVKRAVQVISQKHYEQATVSEGDINTHSISVPDGLAEAKFLLYWNDIAAAAYPIAALVNDLDFSIVDPSGIELLPWQLSIDQPNEAAIRGIDQLNNIEQITIKNPIAGTYSLKVKASRFPLPETQSQAYVVTHDLLEKKLTLDYPNGGEKWLANTTQMIAWTANDQQTGTFKLEYRKGGEWFNIAEEIASNKNNFSWLIPADFQSTELQIRLSRNGTNLSDTSDGEVIVLQAPSIKVKYTCTNVVHLSWDAIDGADGYEVLLFQGDKMLSIAKTNDLEYYVDEGLELGSDYWLAVCARSNNKRGTYETAYKINPQNTGDCDWSNDISLEEIKLDRQRGRDKTSKSISGNTVSVWVYNGGNNTVKGFDLNCIINGDISFKERCDISIPSGERYLYTFINKADFVQSGDYTLGVTADLEGDKWLRGNTSSPMYLTQLDNPELELPIINEFSGAKVKDYARSTLGLEGLESIDFDRVSDVILSVREEEGQNTSLHFVPENKFDFDSTAASLTMTYNISVGAKQKLKLDIDYKFQENKNDTFPNQKIWVRGNDQEEWLLLTEITYSTSWKSLEAIDITPLLRMHNQKASSSSFQVKLDCESAAWSVRKMSVYKVFFGDTNNEPETDQKQGGKNS